MSYPFVVNSFVPSATRCQNSCTPLSETLLHFLSYSIHVILPSSSNFHQFTSILNLSSLIWSLYTSVAIYYNLTLLYQVFSFYSSVEVAVTDQVWRSFATSKVNERSEVTPSMGRREQMNYEVTAVVERNIRFILDRSSVHKNKEFAQINKKM